MPEDRKAGRTRRVRRRPRRRAGGSNPVRRLVVTVFGWSFVVLGVLGLFLPVLQGILFLAIGLVLLSTVSPRVRLMRLRLGNRWPAARTHIESARAWLNRRRARKES